MSLPLISIISIILFSLINCLNPKFGVLEVRSNPLGISSKQDLIPIKLGISEKYPNTRIMTYIDINKDKLYLII